MHLHGAESHGEHGHNHDSDAAYVGGHEIEVTFGSDEKGRSMLELDCHNPTIRKLAALGIEEIPVTFVYKAGDKAEEIVAGRKAELMRIFLGQPKIRDAIDNGNVDAIRKQIVPMAQKLLAMGDSIKNKIRSFDDFVGKYLFREELLPSDFKKLNEILEEMAKNL